MRRNMPRRNFSLATSSMQSKPSRWKQFIEHWFSIIVKSRFSLVFLLILLGYENFLCIWSINRLSFISNLGGSACCWCHPRTPDAMLCQCCLDVLLLKENLFLISFLRMTKKIQSCPSGGIDWFHWRVTTVSLWGWFYYPSDFWNWWWLASYHHHLGYRWNAI